MLAHWDDVEATERAIGDIRATRQRLGAAAGAVEVGCSRWRIPAGARNAPVHVHADEEEIFFVLDGEGLSWQDGRAYPVRAGDVIVHRIDEAPHTLLGGPLDVLAFGEGSTTSLTWLPRPNVMWAGPRWVPLDAPHPFEAEAACGALDAPAPEATRPPNVVALADVEPWVTRRGARTHTARRDLGTAAGSVRSGLKEVWIAPGAEGHPPHCHSAEEELFVVLEGSGTLLLGDERHAVRAGSIVARPAGTEVPHAFEAGPEGLRFLAYGQRDPRDVCFYPRSRKLGIGPVFFRVEPADYWDGEP
ncbi:MAG TPA: cupin domain-containing protein [Capillimicrobium sp.]|nr:cupin domain-containing protein [Capillimicrobium sp.]